MDIRTEMESLPTADGLMPAYLCTPVGKGPHPAVIVVMEAFGLNAHIKNVTERVAREGYVAIAPDFFYRFGSDRHVPRRRRAARHRLHSEIRLVGAHGRNGRGHPSPEEQSR